jgi:hypothetical protein
MHRAASLCAVNGLQRIIGLGNQLRMLRYAPRADAVRTLRLAAIAQQTPPERCAISADFAEIARPIRRIISEFNI